MCERYFLMRLILYIEQKDRLHVLVIWTLKFSCETNQTPRFRALFTVATLVSPTVRVRKLTLLSCWRVPINMTSDLFSLGLREVINLCLCHQTVTKCNNLVQLWNFLFFSEAQGHFLSNGMGFILIILHHFSLRSLRQAKDNPLVSQYFHYFCYFHLVKKGKARNVLQTTYYLTV